VRRASVKLPQLITRQIAAASSLAQLHDIVAANGSRLNHIHVARLLTRTSQLATHATATAGTGTAAPGAAAQQQQQQQQPPTLNLQQQQDDEQHLQLLCSSLGVMMAQRARHATAETLVAAVAAMGRLKCLATGETDVSFRAAAAAQLQQQLQQLAARALELKEDLNISQLSALMWGLAKAGLNPARTWLDTVFDAAMQQYQLAYEQQQQPGEQQQLADLPNQQQQAARDRHAGAAVPQLLQRPTLPQFHQLQQQQQQPAVSLRQTRRQPLLHQHSLATDLALIMYAAAVMGKPPQQQWLVQWQAAVLQQLPAANPQDLSQMLWGLGVLGVNPGQQWLEQVLLAFAEKLDQ